jgi:hypothetical protein
MAEDLNKIRIFRPTPTEEYLGNPHKGCCTFQCFNGDPLLSLDWTKHEQGPLEFFHDESRDMLDPPYTEGYLPCTVAYCRWFWNVLEKRQGEYDFSMVDESLKICAERGQTLAVRLMPMGSINYPGQPSLPDWYKDSGAPMLECKNWNTLVPDYDSEEYYKLWGGLIKEFGRRYDGNPLLESIDVAYLGPWGEGDGVCSQDTCGRFADLWDEAFPNTLKLCLVAAKKGDQMKAGIEKGFGWRADCFGDLRKAILDNMTVDTGWNHLFNIYPCRIHETGARDTWQKAPVHFETGFVPMHWYYKGFDIDFIIQQGLKYHTTYFMPKSAPLPSAWLEKLASFCNDIGYNFLFRQAVVDRETKLDGKMRFRLWIENTGVAPLYHPYKFAIRFRQDQNEQIIILDDTDPRDWLPGDVWIDKSVEVPPGFRTGTLELSAGLIEPVTKKAKIHFAVKERFPDCWTSLGFTEIKDSKS